MADQPPIFIDTIDRTRCVTRRLIIEIHGGDDARALFPSLSFSSAFVTYAKDWQKVGAFPIALTSGVAGTEQERPDQQEDAQDSSASAGRRRSIRRIAATCDVRPFPAHRASFHRGESRSSSRGLPPCHLRIVLGSSGVTALTCRRIGKTAGANTRARFLLHGDRSVLDGVAAPHCVGPLINLDPRKVIRQVISSIQRIRETRVSACQSSTTRTRD